YLLAGGATLALLPLRRAAAESFEVTKDAAEWRLLLSADAYAVLREEATERPGSSLLLHEKRAGLYHCKGCDLAVYSSEHKYDSGTGWPSFWRALPDAIGTKEDDSFFTTRSEVHCRRCGGHFGHIFDDGPPPTGERHCLNGLALNFKPQQA
ncbi:MAG: peptide-methionine (R)-S-oxide reductase MsrB, partial [Bacteroidota bacterium]|nr:peptide-methionine (R)-S-oxide reductase MsrB [Kiloniellaceae bacterium]